MRVQSVLGASRGKLYVKKKSCCFNFLDTDCFVENKDVNGGMARLTTGNVGTSAPAGVIYTTFYPELHC